MIRDDIIHMAREAGSIDSEDVIETVYAAFTAAEREACAQVAFSWNTPMTDQVAKEIRERGNK